MVRNISFYIKLLLLTLLFISSSNSIELSVIPLKKPILDKITKQKKLTQGIIKPKSKPIKKVKKPILLHTESMDFIPYHPYLVNSLFNILVKIYEVDIYSPPQQNNPSLPDFYVKKIFEKKETLNWEKIKKDFKIEYIIVPSDWSLKIKLINKDKKYKLYKIL